MRLRSPHRAALVVLLLAVAVTAAAVPAAAAERAAQPIVHGLTTTDVAAVALIGSSNTALPSCSGTLVGCRTVLTAAHCFCFATPASRCVPEVLADRSVFLQHGGVYSIESVAIHPGYRFGRGGDLALVRLDRQVEGIRPMPLNPGPAPAVGTPGTIVGFGRTGEHGPIGLKRHGRVETAPCVGVDPARHVCWRFEEPLGEPGESSSVCEGDSGGPLLVDFGAGPVVAGVSSGLARAGGPFCTPGELSFEVDVAAEREWIVANAGGDLGPALCGELPPVGSPGVSVQSVEQGAFTGPRQVTTLEVPPGTRLLRAGLNFQFGDWIEPGADLDLALRHGAEPAADAFDCRSSGGAPVESCEVEWPLPGTWHLAVERVAGGADYQLVATLFAAASGAAEPCSPGPHTLCLDDLPGDRRYRVEVRVATSQGGGVDRAAEAMPLPLPGAARGGLFTFFHPSNPEMLIKVLDGCPVNGHRWVFYAAATNAGFRATVTDTRTGRVWERTHPDREPAAPVQDTDAFPCGDG